LATYRRLIGGLEPLLGTAIVVQNLGWRFLDWYEFEFALGRICVFNVGVLGGAMFRQRADEAA
jgi:hypothetical protein